ncbi:hypothetical protein [Peptostreptococcus russellii]|uniref:hypothetical protein n=1 Tax=Peptostreptococcus russellii TaxID=215200 RepID=UPI003F585C37
MESKLCYLNNDLKIKSVERLGGQNRYETASIIGNKVREKSGNKDDTCRWN